MRKFTGIWLALYWSAAACAPLLVHRDAGAAEAPAPQATIEFNIEPQALDEALNQFALQSGREILFSAADTADKKSARLSGQYTAIQALEILLSDSGLPYRINELNTVLIGSVSSGIHTSQAETFPQMVLSQAEIGATAVQTIPAGGKGGIAGHVTDDTAAKNLPGALVRLVEAGVTTQTDNLGFFYFRGLPAGEYTLSISYLGYAEKYWRVNVDGNGQMQEYPLSFAEASQENSDVAQLTVYGTRIARALALNQQRTAENNSEVVSADLLGDFTGTTISEALRRVAGVSFIRDPVTGEGTNIIVRGLEPDMNAVKLNGLNLPVGNGQSRSGSLNNILADSVSKITIHKSLLPSMDSAGTGGLVEIETQSPLERPARYVNISAEGGRKGAAFGNDYLLSGTVSRQFGKTNNFGLSASAQYRRQVSRTAGYSTTLQFGEWLPLGPHGQPSVGPYDLDPRRDFPYEEGVDGVYANGSTFSSSDADISTLAVTLGAAWQISDRSTLKLDVQHSKSDKSTFNGSASAVLGSAYIPRPVAALGGEIRRALTYDGNAFAQQNYSTVESDSTTDTYSLRGSSMPGKWTINYTGGFAHGTDRVPEYTSLGLGFENDGQSGNALLLPEAVDPVEGVVVSAFGRRSGRGMPLPLLTHAAWNFFNNADNYYLSSAGINSSAGRDDSYTGDLSARRDLNWGILKYLEVGTNFRRSKLTRRDSGLSANVHTDVIFLPDPPYVQIIYPSAAPLGLTFKPGDLARVGHPGEGFHYLDESGVRNFFSGLDGLVAQGGTIDSISEIAQSPLAEDTFTVERNFAGYLQGKLQIGRMEIVGGARLSSVEVQAVSLYGPALYDVNFTEDLQFRQDFAQLQDESARQTDLLPRVVVNYRQTDNLIFRGGYFLTTARPSISQLSSSETISLYQRPIFGPEQNQQQLFVYRGNPALRPAVTHNFDLDAEYYDSRIGVIRLGGFYKKIENALQNNEVRSTHDLSGVTLPDHPAFQSLTPQNTLISSSQPVNSPYSAAIWGLEAHVERQFSFLPGLWSGLGMYANYSYSHSSAHQAATWQEPLFDALGNLTGYRAKILTFTGVPFSTQPSYTGTLALTYAGRGLDATLAYGFQDRYQSFFTASNLDAFNESVKTLDLRASYYFGWNGMNVRVALEGTDLLKGPHNADLETSTGVAGGGTYINGGNFLGGRELRLGLSTTF